MKIKWNLKRLDLLEVIQTTHKEVYIETQNEQEFNALYKLLIDLKIGADLNKGKFEQGGCGYIILRSRNFGAFDTKDAKRDGAEIYQYSQFKT